MRLARCQGYRPLRARRSSRAFRLAVRSSAPRMSPAPSTGLAPTSSSTIRPIPAATETALTPRIAIQAAIAATASTAPIPSQRHSANRRHRDGGRPSAEVTVMISSWRWSSAVPGAVTELPAAATGDETETLARAGIAVAPPSFSHRAVEEPTTGCLRGSDAAA